MTSTFLKISLLLLALPLAAQERRLWVLRPSGEMVEYDLATFTAKQTIKLPADAAQSPQSISVNHLGHMLFSTPPPLPLAETDVDSPPKVWFWNGHAATTLDLGTRREISGAGSNQAVNESAAAVYLSADGAHLDWFANQARRLERDDVDLSTATTWKAWRTDLTGASREDLTSTKFPDCRCPTGTCEESCPYGQVWTPGDGIGKVFLMSQFVAGKTTPIYKESSRCQQDGSKWTCTALSSPLRRVLDADSEANVIVEAIPDTGCCGWSNQSDDQTLVRANGKPLTVFDELATYKNSDYDVSFYTANARLSPSLASIAMTITSTAEANKPIQLAEEGQANPEESKAIRKALAELPAVEVKSIDAKSATESPAQLAFVPHATLVGWINEKEILMVEDHMLVVFNVAKGVRRRSAVRVEDAAHVFLR
jgi:hypothetical protein